MACSQSGRSPGADGWRGHRADFNDRLPIARDDEALPGDNAGDESSGVVLELAKADCVHAGIVPESRGRRHGKCRGPNCYGVNMKFLTLEWWCGVQENDLDNDPAENYLRYLATIRDRLPAGLLALQESVSLHDGNLRELTLSIPEATLSMIVDADDGSGGLRKFSLRYSGVSLFQSIADPDVGLLGPHGYGDWGYDEADVTESGELQHRILFSSGIEIVVQFTGFALA